MGGLYTVSKTWTDNETLTNEDLNLDFNQVKEKMAAEFVEGYSSLNNVDNLARIQTQTDPAPSGNPLNSAANSSVSGELQRLRYVISRMIGGTYWYDTPSTSINTLNTTLSSVFFLPNNRVISGRVSSTSNQPMWLVPQAATNAITLKCTSTNLVCSIDGTQYTFSTDINLTGLTLGPSAIAANQCLVNDTSLTGQQSSKLYGEDRLSLTVDTMGANVSALIGTYQAFKLVGGTTEYLFGYIESATKISNAFRGFFFNSSDASIPRAATSDNNVLTLCKMTYVFVTSAGTLDVTYNAPFVDASTPASASAGDYWFDQVSQKWKKYSGTVWNDATATLVGFCLQDSATTVGARSIDPHKNYQDKMNLRLSKFSNDVIRTAINNNILNVYGQDILTNWKYLNWDMATDLDTGVTDAANTRYYLYLSDKGKEVISNVAPYNRVQDLAGYYHPSQSWRCVGFVDNDGSSNFTSPRGFKGETPTDSVVVGSVGSGSAATTTPTATSITATISTTGRPVRIDIFPNNPGTASTMSDSTSGGGVHNSFYSIYRGSTEICRFQNRSVNPNDSYITPVITAVDSAPGVGRVTYTLYVFSDGGSTSCIAADLSMMATEMAV